jgi:hypothetical protein
MDLSILSSEEDMIVTAAEYRPRHPQDSDYYHCVEDYFETFVRDYNVSPNSTDSGGLIFSR